MHHPLTSQSLKKHLSSQRLKMGSWLQERLSNSSLAGDGLPLMLSIVVGVVTSLCAYLFILMVAEIGAWAELLRQRWGLLGGLIGMLSAGFLTGLIVSRYAHEVRGGGVPEVMEAIALKRGMIRPRVALAKLVSSATTIGSGGSAGREGPIVQVGSTLGSTAGQWARLTDEQIGMLVASGAAAGIAATFNAPIAGTLFALEVILGRFTNRYLGIVVIAAVSANVVSRSLLGENPAFAVPAYGLNSPLELPLYFILGGACALASILFIWLLYKTDEWFSRWRLPLPLVTSLGLGLTAVVGFLHPAVYGPGLDFIGSTITANVNLSIPLMLSLAVLKLLATALTLGSGNSGGTFAPGLFIGAMLGGAFGQFGAQIMPTIITEPGAFALVGMAAVFAGSARAPITAIIIVLEMSNDYRLILPLLMTVIVSTLISELLYQDSIYTRKLTKRGIRIEKGHDIDLLQGVHIRDVMTKDYPTVSPRMRVKELIPQFNKTHHHGFPIVDQEGMLRGVVTLSDVERVHPDTHSEFHSVEQMGTTQNLVTVYPHDPIYLALQRMNSYDIGRLPVVAADESGKYLGMIRRVDILRAYDVGLTRKSIERHKKSFSLRHVEENEFMEFVAEPGAPMTGRPLSQFPLSQACHIVSIRRRGQVVIAQGETHIEAGDIIVAYVYPSAHDAVLAQFQAQYRG